MSEPKTHCRKCQAEILERTAQRNGGLCMRCRYPVPVMPAQEVKPGRHVDSMLIDLRRDVETEDYADYFFACTVFDKDPRFRTRSMIVGNNVGLLRITEATGQIELLRPMAEDEGNHRYMKAASTVARHWREGKLPEFAIYASG
jgi:hypothetical protein